MKATMNTPKEVEKNITFPCLMISHDGEGRVVLFESESKGTVVAETRPHWGIGHHAEGWLDASSPHWTPYKGTITLEND